MINRLIAKSNTCDGKRLFYFLFLHFTKFYVKGFTCMHSKFKCFRELSHMITIQYYNYLPFLADQMEEKESFFNVIVFSDEASFHKNECVSDKMFEFGGLNIPM